MQTEIFTIIIVHIHMVLGVYTEIIRQHNRKCILLLRKKKNHHETILWKNVLIFQVVIRNISNLNILAIFNAAYIIGDIIFSSMIRVSCGLKNMVKVRGREGEQM